MSAIKAVNQVNRSGSVLSRSFEKISQGLRLVRARDGAAELAIATRKGSLSQSWNSALRNTGKGMSLVQTAEGDLGAIGDILTRMRQLAVQSSNGMYSDADRGHLNSEFLALRTEIQRIASMSHYNGISLLSKSSGAITLQIGVHSADSVSLQFGGGSAGSVNGPSNSGNGNSNSNATALANRNKGSEALNAVVIDLATIAVSLGGLGISLAGVDSMSGANQALDNIDSAIYSILVKRSTLGGTFNQLQHALSESTAHHTNLRASQSKILDLDYAREAAMVSRFRIIHQASIASVGQASQINKNILTLLS